MNARHICPECGETAVNRPPKSARSGWTLTVDADRLKWSHTDREPLCPVMTSKGYQPALPAEVTA